MNQSGWMDPAEQVAARLQFNATPRLTCAELKAGILSLMTHVLDQSRATPAPTIR